jgi:hypothetical protein
MGDALYNGVVGGEGRGSVVQCHVVGLGEGSGVARATAADR